MNAYRDGKVHVRETMCETCVFRPGNLMQLQPGRLADLVRTNVENESALICHATLPEMGEADQAVCRGFYDRHATAPLQIAGRLDLIEWVA